MKKLVLLLAVLFSLSATAETESVVSAALKSGSITRTEARNIYLLKNRTWIDGTTVVVFRLPLDNRMHKEFIRDVLGMNQVQFDNEWSKLVNAGISPQIQEVERPGMMLSAIARKPNAVGYLSKDYIVLNAGGSDVQVIAITD